MIRIAFILSLIAIIGTSCSQEHTRTYRVRVTDYYGTSSMQVTTRPVGYRPSDTTDWLPGYTVVVTDTL